MECLKNVENIGSELMDEKCRVDTQETNKIRQSEGRTMSEESDSTIETNLSLLVNMTV